MPMTLLVLFSLALIWTERYAYAEHGNEIIISIGNSTLIPLASDQGNQVRILVNYVVFDSSLVGETINAVMKIYNLDGKLLKTSSYPSGFLLQNENGKAELKSTLTGTVNSVVAEVTFTTLDKTEVLSEAVQTRVDPTIS